MMLGLFAASDGAIVAAYGSPEAVAAAKAAQTAARERADKLAATRTLFENVAASDAAANAYSAAGGYDTGAAGGAGGYEGGYGGYGSGYGYGGGGYGGYGSGYASVY